MNNNRAVIWIAGIVVFFFLALGLTTKVGAHQSVPRETFYCHAFYYGVVPNDLLSIEQWREYTDIVENLCECAVTSLAGRVTHEEWSMFTDDQKTFVRDKIREEDCTQEYQEQDDYLSSKIEGGRT